MEFNLLAPTAFMFAERYIRAVNSCPNTFKHLVTYLCELALLSDKIILRYVVFSFYSAETINRPDSVF